VLTVRDGRSASDTDPAYETSYTYDSAGDVTAVTTPPVAGFPRGRTTTVTYSDATSAYPAADGGNVPAGLPVKTVSPGGATQVISYFHDGDVAQTTSADGLVTNYAYDGLGRVLGETQVSSAYPLGLTTSYTYDGQGRVLTETDPPVTNQVTGVVHTAKTTTAYDPDGDILTQTVADLTGGNPSRTVSRQYNSHDQVISSTDADGNTTRDTYDAYGNEATETDPDGNETTYTYDPDGDLLRTTLENFTGSPEGSSPAANLIESSRAYDPAGRLASVTDAMGDTTSYTYTDNGLLATTTRSNAAGTSGYVEEADSYDAAGNLIKTVTGNGATTTDYTVDAADRTSGEALDPAGVDRVTTVAYTPDDQPAVTQQTSGGGAGEVTAETYDPMGNLTSRSVYADAAGHPVGWWPLSQSSGTTVQDASGTGNTAAADGVTWSAGGAASFAGTAGQQIATNGPVLNTTSSYSVSAWVNLAAVPSGFQTAVSQDAEVNSGFYLQYDAADHAWAFSEVASDTTNAAGIRAHASGTPTAGQWYDLTGTYDAATGVMTLYVNGAAAGTATDKSPVASSGPLAIGRAKFNGSRGDLFAGQVADVQVYDQTLSQTEAAALYAAGRSGGAAGSSRPVTTTWNLDQRGLPTSMTDPDGNTTTYVYDPAGELVQTSDPAVPVETDGGTAVETHPVTTTGYDTFGEQTQAVDPDGNVTTTGYDGDGNVASQTLPSYTPPGSATPVTATTTNAYDGDGNLVKQTDPLGNVTTSAYDQLGDLTSVTAPNNGVTSYSYDDDGNKVAEVNPTGARTQYTYDYLDRMDTSAVLERYPSPQALTTDYAYTPSATDPGGAWLSGVTTPDGVTTSYGYNAVGELTSLTDGAGNTTTTGYDFLGRQTTVTAPDGTSQTTSYDVLGDPVRTQNLDASGNVLTTQSATYDNDGDLRSSTDPRGDTATFSYDATGLITQEVQPVSATSSITTSFGYDADGNETRYTDGDGNPWIYTYNPWNLQQSETEPATPAYPTAADSTFTTAYDADGRPVSQTQPGGVTLTDSYDSVGDVTGQSGTGADAPTAARTFGYDLSGDMTSASTSAAGPTVATSESFTYNDRGELLTASGTAGSSSFVYNGDGLVSSATTAAGTTSYAYDDDDRLSGLTDPATGTTLGYQYNDDSELSLVSYGATRDTQGYQYNSLHELTSDTLSTASGSTIASISYGYDPDGNLTAKDTTGLAGATGNTYTYDEANRLTSWDNGTATTDYAYDADGNRTEIGSASYTYDARDELTSGGGATYTYTANGTLASTTTASGTVNSTFDAYGQQITDGTESYTYDALDRDVGITSAPAAGTPPASGTPGATASARATVPAGATRTLTYAGTSDDITSDGANTYTWTPGGTLTGIGVAGGTAADGVLALTDQHTDVVGDFTADGGLAGSTAYDPLGNVIATSGTPAGSLGYQSAFTDTATGKVEMGSRWYNPATGNFTSRDTTANSPDPNSVAANPFAYAGDSPLVNIDPTGDSWFSSLVHKAANTLKRAASKVKSVGSSVERELKKTAVGRAVLTAVNVVVDVAKTELDAVRTVSRVVTQKVTNVAKTAAKLVPTVYAATVTIAKAGATFVKAHASAIASFAASAGVFAGCEAFTAGIGTVGCAAAAGAAGNLVSYGMSCGSSAGGCSVTGALTAGLSGAAAGAVGGLLGGPLGGKLASSLLGDVLPGIAVRGLTGAIAGAAAGSVANAISYAGGCAQGSRCTWSGFAGSVESGAVTGAALGGLFGAVMPESPAEKSTDPGASGDPGTSGDPNASPEGEPTSSDDGGAAKAAPEATGGGGPEEQPAEEPSSCQIGGESFTASTKVLLASGAAVAISQLKPGEKVLATNTKTGKTQPEMIAAVLVHYDTDLYDLTVKSGGHTEVIHTTSNHLFWDPSLKQWIPANHLKKDEHLRTPDGTTAVADRGTTPKVHDGWMWDLTVPGNNDHDFYVVATTAAVLVHNESCPMIGSNGARFTSQEMGRGKGWRVDAENPNPGGRPGQLHLQDYSGNKYQYNFETGQFEGMPGRLAKTLQNDPQVQRAIARGLQYLGEDG
jgi:large repetitive protein